MQMRSMAAAVFAAGLGAWAQGFPGMALPDMPGQFKPVVGAGAQYKVITDKAGPMDFSYAIVGQEGGAYWMEIRTNSPKGDVVMKQLVTLGAGQKPEVRRMIFQTAGRPPMEMPMSMVNGMMSGAAGRMGGAAPAGPPASAMGGAGTKIGTETITVAAGTFECEHYSHEANGRKGDVWISTQVSPYGVVKMVSNNTQMELVKVLSHETSKIVGQPMPIPGMPQR